MIYQIAGIVILSISLICGTWYAVTVRREKLNTQREIAKARAAATERMVSNGTWSLYESEREKRIAAETQVGILRHQLARAREQMAKVTIGK